MCKCVYVFEVEQMGTINDISKKKNPKIYLIYHFNAVSLTYSFVNALIIRPISEICHFGGSSCKA